MIYILLPIICKRRHIGTTIRQKYKTPCAGLIKSGTHIESAIGLQCVSKITVFLSVLSQVEYHHHSYDKVATYFLQ